MKKTILWALALLTAGSITLISCGKYEDGPGLSLRGKKGRLAGDWMVEKATSTNGSNVIDYTSLFANYEFTYDKDGTYTLTVGSVSTIGTWEFNDDKSQLITTSSSGNKDTSTITRLTNKEFWTKDTYNGTTDEIHFAAHGH